MDITHLTDSLAQDLARAAGMGGDDVRAAAERLLVSLEPALRLTLMEAFSEAAQEISAAAPPLSVSVHLKGREPVFVVESAPAPVPPPDDEPLETEDGEAVARITLRLPEGLKGRAEALAARRGQSLNTWLVAAARAAAAEGPHSQGHGRHGRSRHIHVWAR